MAPSERVRALIYDENKDYERECDAIEKIFASSSTKKITSILDIGCGTGSHALILSDRKYRVVGVDLSKVMVREAKDRATSATAPLNLFS